MSPSADALALLRSWDRGPAAPDTPVAAQLVHKQRPVNILLAEIQAVPGGADEFACRVLVRTDHDFFYDHPLDHVPGMLLVEAARQLGMAVCHQYFGVPAGAAFVLSEMHLHFRRFVELDWPLYAVMRVRSTTQRRGQLTTMESEAEFVQMNTRLADMHGSWQIRDTRVLTRIRAAGYQEMARQAQAYDTWPVEQGADA